MLLTEEEAKKKRCPQLTFDIKSRVDHNISRVASKCLGSECMMWRIETVPRATEIDCEFYGWCGLAGTPREVIQAEEM